MCDVLFRLDTLQRPRLLIRAARAGAENYRRAVHLRRHLGYGALPRSADALRRLAEIEAELDAHRRRRHAGYSPAQHVEVLIAMLGEARLLRALAPAPVT